jgi:hypothetical protein
MYNDEESEDSEEEEVDDSEDAETLLKKMSLECQAVEEEGQEYAIREFNASQYPFELC